MTGILSAFFGGNYGAKPNAPTVGTATVTGTTTATLTFSAPAFDGGVTITSYTATSSPGGITSTLNQSGGGTFNITGLTAGTTYTFSVTATNPIGTSASSGASNSITTYSVPVNTVAPVVSGTATFGQTLTTTTGTWTGVPASFTYAYQWQRAGSNIGGATSSTYQLVSADIGNAIRCVVTATNTAGSTAANSNATAAVVAAVPGAPQSVSATATGSSTATVSWSAPADNGGATITSYSIYWSGGSTSTSSTSVGATGLTPSTSYTFTVYATNSAGTGSGATSNSITTSAARGSALYYSGSAGCYTWYAPAGVTKISVIITGAGGAGKGRNSSASSSGGNGGGSIYQNNWSVTPGTGYRVVVPSFSQAFQFYRSESPPCWIGTLQRCFQRVFCAGGSLSNGGGGYGGLGGDGFCAYYGLSVGAGGGGGAAGIPSLGNYNVIGGAGGITPCSNPYGQGPNGTSGTAGGGSGGGGGSNQVGGGGGGMGAYLYGAGSSGAGGGLGSCFIATGGGGGSGGASGGTGVRFSYGGAGGFPGGGGGGLYNVNTCSASTGGGGVMRIIWPGNTRGWPNTDLTD